MDAQKIEAADSEAMADAVMEHLGPLALTHGHISPIDAFELGWKARAQTLASKEAELVRLRAILQKLVHDLSEDHGAEDFEVECPSCQLVKAANDALTQPPKEPT